MSPEIKGHCDPRFQEVAEAFHGNFRDRNEVGASVCLTHHGETVVDLWGGQADPKADRPWERDSVSIVYSCTKAATALCAHLLIERGELDLHAPVIRYWPEFGRNGKEKITVAMLLNHSAGLPTFREPLKQGGCYDWDYMIGRLEDEEPFWEPGTRNGYHMLTFGWTVGEVVRRVGGRSLGEFFRREIAEPLGIDFWIGLPEEMESRVAPMIPPALDSVPVLPEFFRAVLSDVQSVQGKALLNSGGFNANSREAHVSEIGGAGGISNARGLAGLFSPLACGGAMRVGNLISPEAIVRMSQVSMATQRDFTLMTPSRFSLGFMRGVDNRYRPAGNLESLILGEKAFGHVGAGGSLVFADPECNLSFGYTMNRMDPSILLSEKGQMLVDAAYRSLGYSSSSSGAWIRK